MGKVFILFPVSLSVPPINQASYFIILLAQIFICPNQHPLSGAGKKAIIKPNFKFAIKTIS